MLGDHEGLALRREQDNLDRPGLHDVQRVAGVTLVEDRVVAPVAADPQLRGALLQDFLAAAGEQRAGAQRVDGEGRQIAGDV